MTSTNQTLKKIWFFPKSTSAWLKLGAGFLFDASYAFGHYISEAPIPFLHKGRSRVGVLRSSPARWRIVHMDPSDYHPQPSFFRNESLVDDGDPHPYGGSSGIIATRSYKLVFFPEITSIWLKSDAGLLFDVFYIYLILPFQKLQFHFKTSSLKKTGRDELLEFIGETLQWVKINFYFWPYLQT